MAQQRQSPTATPQPPPEQALPAQQREQMERDFEQLLTEMQEAGELLGGEALGDPATARLYRWADGEPIATDGPYAETKEQLLGFYVIDCADEDEARIVSGAAAASSRANSSRLTSSRSGPFSWTRAAPSSAASSEATGRMRPAMAGSPPASVCAGRSRAPRS